jgi:hypothetical protein
VRHVSADLALAPVNELLDLRAGGEGARPGDVALLSAVSMCFALGAAKCASENYGIDKICDYIAGVEANTKITDYPARRKANAAVRDAQKALAAAERELAVLLADPAITPAAKNTRLIPAAQKKITAAGKRLDAAASARDAIPAKLPANDIHPGAEVAVLRTRRRGLQMVLRLLAHNAEHWLSSHLNAYLRDDDEYRAVTPETIIRGLAGTITSTPAAITVTLEPPGTPASPAHWPRSSTRSTPPRLPCPATPVPSPAPSPTSSPQNRPVGHATGTNRTPEAGRMRPGSWSAPVFSAGPRSLGAAAGSRAAK